MQRRSLTHSRHISPTVTTGDTRGRALRLVTAAGLASAMLLGTGLAQADPEPTPPAGPTVDSPAVTSATASTPGDRTTRARDTARSGKASARERSRAREAIRQSVADRALRQAGDRYAAGAEGPDAFDCSGLTLFAWRSAGVELTHYSAGQYQQVRPISADAAVPGDLVFYLTGGARHVAVYIGDGKIVHASDYGVGVIVSSVRGTPWTNAHFTGFGRVPIPDETLAQVIEDRRKRR